MTEIARLLAESLQAHQQAKRARFDGQLALCRDHWQTALNARTDAHNADPDHSDPAWHREHAATPQGFDTHTGMLQFYAERGVVYQGQPKAPIPRIERIAESKDLGLEMPLAQCVETVKA